LGVFILFNWYVCYILLSSPFLFVIGDDRVIRYTGADDDTGDAEGAQATEWGLAGIRARDISTMFSLCFEIFGIVSILWFNFI